MANEIRLSKLSTTVTNDNCVVKERGVIFEYLKTNGQQQLSVHGVYRVTKENYNKQKNVLKTISCYVKDAIVISKAINKIKLYF